MLAIQYESYDNGRMKTVKFGFDRSTESDHAPIIMSVPSRVQEGMDYSYGPIVRKISKGLTSGLSMAPTDAGAQYRIDGRALGKATLRARGEGLTRTMQLILAIQQIAVRSEMLDPNLRLFPTVSPQAGSLPLAARLNLHHAVTTSAELLQATALGRMVASHHELLNPHGSLGQSTRSVSLQIYPEQGLLMAVGQPRECIKAKPSASEPGMYELRGQTSSHEHSLILMAGAVALAEVASLATPE